MSHAPYLEISTVIQVRQFLYQKFMHHRLKLHYQRSCLWNSLFPTHIPYLSFGIIYRPKIYDSFMHNTILINQVTCCYHILDSLTWGRPSVHSKMYGVMWITQVRNQFFFPFFNIILYNILTKLMPRWICILNKGFVC